MAGIAEVYYLVIWVVLTIPKTQNKQNKLYKLKRQQAQKSSTSKLVWQF
jgi:hypothetical protein